MSSGGLPHLFDDDYYSHHCGGIPYERNDLRMAAFDRIAERIIADFQPRTVLDAGCAKGFLVERLRARGVEAWGIDISEYAINNVHPDIKNFCSVGSIADPLPQRYDLIITIEVVEHMPPQEATKAIENLCQYTDNLILSSTPYDYKEDTHFNVNPPDHWARQLARYHFFHDMDYDASYITDWAMRFYRLTGSVQPVIQAYERHLWQLKTEVRELRGSVIEYSQQRQTLEAKQKYLSDLENTQSWKIVHKLQRLRARLLPTGGRINQSLKRLFRRK